VPATTTVPAVRARTIACANAAGACAVTSTPVLPRPAGRAIATRLKHLDRDPVPGRYTPAPRGGRPDRLDDPDRLVTGDQRKPAGKLAGVLLVVGPAQPAGFHPQQRVVLAQNGNGDLPEHQPARRFQYQDTRERGVPMAAP
jgi:hypothetical protein